MSHILNTKNVLLTCVTFLVALAVVAGSAVWSAFNGGTLARD